MPGRITETAFSDAGTFLPGPGTLTTLNGFNPSSSTVFVQVFDKAVAPVLADVPAQSIQVPGVSSYSWTPSPQANPFVEGIVWGVSSTPDTYTPAAVDVWVRFEGNEQ